MSERTRKRRIDLRYDFKDLYKHSKEQFDKKKIQFLFNFNLVGQLSLFTGISV